MYVLRTDVVVVLVRPVAAVVDLVAESPARDAPEVVAAEAARRLAVDRLADGVALVRPVAAVVIAVTHPLGRDADLQTSDGNGLGPSMCWVGLG